jgi:hypothetical protein
MSRAETASEDPLPPLVRRGLLLILIVGIVGTGLELFLLLHFEDAWQLVPLVLMGLSLVVLTAHAIAPSPGTIRLLQGLMLLFLASGAAGVILHYRGNVEFELERLASQSGLELFRNAMMGATPMLAPGAMAQLGFIGLLYTYRHPALTRRGRKLPPLGSTP